MSKRDAASTHAMGICLGSVEELETMYVWLPETFPLTLTGH